MDRYRRRKKEMRINETVRKNKGTLVLFDGHGPTSLTAVVLERWVVLVEVLLVVVGVQGRTKTALGHVEAKGGSVEVLVEMGTGLVPGFADYPSSTTVESERMVVVVVVVEVRTHLSDDEDTVKDMGSELEGSKRWARGG